MAGLTLSTTLNNAGQFPKNVEPLPSGQPFKIWAGVVAFDTTYPCGGYTLTASLFGMTKVLAAVSSPTSGGNPTDTASGKLRVFDSIGTETVAANQDLSLQTVSIVVYGI